MKLRFEWPFGFGDQIATIYTLENCGRQTGSVFELCGGNIEYIAPHFQLQYVKTTQDLTNSIHSIEIRSKQSSVEYKTEGYIHYVSRLMLYMQEHFDYNPLKSLPLNTKYVRTVGQENLCQFDSRFLKHNTHIDVTNEEIKIWIRKLSDNKNIRFIGGKDTKIYINNYIFELGDIDFIIQKLMSCKKFVGLDSGMSHLAGALGIPCETIVLVPNWFAGGILNKTDKMFIADEDIIENDMIANKSLKSYHEKSYRFTKCHTRDDLKILF